MAGFRRVGHILSRIAIALFVTEWMNYPPFVLQLDTKNTLKLTPLDTGVFSLYCYQRHLQRHQ